MDSLRLPPEKFELTESPNELSPLPLPLLHPPVSRTFDQNMVFLSFQIFVFSRKRNNKKNNMENKTEIMLFRRKTKLSCLSTEESTTTQRGKKVTLQTREEDHKPPKRQLRAPSLLSAVAFLALPFPFFFSGWCSVFASFLWLERLFPSSFVGGAAVPSSFVGGSFWLLWVVSDVFSEKVVESHQTVSVT